MFFGQNVLAQVWSFSNGNSDIPYLLSYISGKYKCGCPSHAKWRRNVDCKHISEFKRAIVNNTIINDQRFTLSDFGEDFIKRK